MQERRRGPHLNGIDDGIGLLLRRIGAFNTLPALRNCVPELVLVVHVLLDRRSQVRNQVVPLLQVRLPGRTGRKASPRS